MGDVESFKDLQIPYVGVAGYLDAYTRIRQSPKAIMNYLLYCYARMKQVVSDEEHLRLWRMVQQGGEYVQREQW